MGKAIHPNASISSNLFRLSALLTLIGYFSFEDRKSVYVMLAALFAIFLLIGAAYLIRNGNIWIRWVLTPLLILGIVVDIVTIQTRFKVDNISTYFGILQDIIQLIATILLFIPYEVPQDMTWPTEFSEP